MIKGPVLARVQALPYAPRSGGYPPRPRSRDGEDPGMSKGPVLARVQALPYAPHSGGDPLLPRGLWPVT